MSGIYEWFILLAYSLGCTGIGLVACKLLGWKITRFNIVSPLAMIMSGFLLGQGIVALMLTIMGLVGLLVSWVVWLMIVGGLLGGILISRPIFLTVPDQLTRLWSDIKGENWGWRLIPFLVGLIIVLKGLNCLIPLTGWDAIVVYMAEAKLMAATGSITPLPGVEYGLKLGLVGELHYSALMTLGASSETIRLFTLYQMLAMGIIFAALGRRTGMERRGQWILVTIIFTSTVATNIITDGKVGLYGAALGTAAFFWASLIGTEQRYERSILRITAVYAGLSVVAKPTYVIALIIPLLIFVTWRKLILQPLKNPREIIRLLFPLFMVLGIWMFIPLVPHMIKNAVIFQDPLAPFLGNTGSYWLSQEWMSAENVRRMLPIYPLALVFADYPSPISQYGRLSFAALALFPLIFLMPRRGRFSRSMIFQFSMVGILGIILWIIVFPSIFVPRYFMATLFLLALIPARAGEYASIHWRSPLHLDWMVLLTLYFVVYGFFRWDYISYYPTNVISLAQLPGYVERYIKTTNHESCDDIQDFCKPFEFINHQADMGERIFFTGGAAVFYLRLDLMQCMRISSEPWLSTDINQNWRMLVERGFSWLVVWNPQYGYEMLGFPDHIPDWIELETIFDGPTHIVYRFSNNSIDFEPRFTCYQVTPKEWHVVEIDQ